ncbi:hypothetical protein NLI96_g5390 [Meripilus lineatus]|uniref:Uncharacterized protein n=1 Tax=Meripilus lineatus TaxID=2056292 RepID=A0AAD5YJ20_9APHY|nr:hypothetical protein NLI96_g5390 [Physisporinus lineatus]
MHAYRAFGDSFFLQTAMTSWRSLNLYTVTQRDADSGFHVFKDPAILPLCNGATSAGGVFRTRDDTDTEVNGGTVCAFMVISAYLFGATSTAMYHDAASLSAQFIKAQLYNGTIVLHGISLSDCSPNTDVATHNSGLFIEGLSVLTNYTRSEEWTPFKMTLPHSVCPDLTEFQYNALVDLASFPGVNEFSPSWLGPPVSQHLPWGQAAAIDVLNAASDIAPRRRAGISEAPPQNQQSELDTLGPIPGVQPFMSTGIGKAQYYEKALDPPSSSDDMTTEDSSGGAVVHSNRDASSHSSPSHQIPIRSVVSSIELHPELSSDLIPLPPGIPNTRDNSGSSTIAVLLERLNQELAMLPPRVDNSSLDPEEPPEYVGM